MSEATVSFECVTCGARVYWRSIAGEEAPAAAPRTRCFTCEWLLHAVSTDTEREAVRRLIDGDPPPRLQPDT